MRLMDLVFRIVSKGKGLWSGSAEKPKQLSEEKIAPVHDTLAQAMIRQGWTPPKQSS